MIIGKKDKQKLKQLENENKLLNSNLMEAMRRDDLMQIIKAIINKFGQHEIIIEQREIREAEKYELFVTRDLMKFATIYRTVSQEQILKSYKEEK